MSNSPRDGVAPRIGTRRTGHRAAWIGPRVVRRAPLVVFLLVTLALCTACSTLYAQAAPQGGVLVGTYAQVVNSPILHLRTGPGLSYTIILTMPQGATVSVLDGPFTGDNFEWLKVSYNGTIGFAADRWLAPTSAPLVDHAPDRQVQVVNTSILHLRSGPGLRYAVLMTMPGGAVVTVKDGPFPADSYQWYKVSYAGTIGFAAGMWLAPTSAPSPPRSIAAGGYAQVVNYTILHLRTGPGTGYPIIVTMPEGAIVQVVQGPEYGSGYTWWCVAYNGHRGYAAAPWLASSQPPGS